MFVQTVNYLDLFKKGLGFEEEKGNLSKNMSVKGAKSKEDSVSIQRSERRDPGLLYLLCEAGRPGSKSPLSKIINLRSVLHFIFTYVVGERPTYCRWNEHKSAQGLLYASYVPVNKKPKHNIILLYLHGSSSRGSCYAKMRLQSLPRVVQETENFPYTVVCPLCPLKTEWSKPTMLNKLGNLIDDLRDMHGSSASIVVTGPSMGGLGSYMIAAKYAEKITAAIPICGGGKKVFARLVANKVPCWFFHAANDTCVSVLETDQVVDEIRSLTPIHLHERMIKYTRYDSCDAPWNVPWCPGHDAFSPCYKDNWPQVCAWMGKLI